MPLLHGIFWKPFKSFYSRVFNYNTATHCNWCGCRNHWIGKQVSISQTFYWHLFHTKVFCSACLSLQHGFVTFWQKDIGAKAVHKILMKLTTGVNFTNILWAIFSMIYFCQKNTNPNCEHINAAENTFVQKSYS